MGLAGDRSADAIALRRHPEHHRHLSRDHSRWRPEEGIASNIGALIIRIGSCSILYYNSNKEATKEV